VELKDVFQELEAVNLETGDSRTFSLEECHFGYRDSIFKQELKGKYFISSVSLKLSRNANFKIAYGDLKNVLGDNALTLRAISNAVIKIRTSKLPDPKEIGNAGSFFKNPVIPIHQFRTLLEKYPSLPSYPAPMPNLVKIPAGWLIEQAGWKGYRKGNIGVHEKQALVLVNYGGGKGCEIYQLALDIKADVFEKFGVEIEPEVNVW
jgi:UDP-N-acetylmuramate dehydrogenase